jgi:hypothetical protein
MTMHTKDILSAALVEVGLPIMAVKAAQGYYHDFLSPLDFPELDLIGDLTEIGTPTALAMRARVMDGEFDASIAESDAWVASPDGQETISRLTGESQK